jgi:hypothetical protein
MEDGLAAGSGSPSPEELVQRPHTHWIEPIADDYAIATDADPSERAILFQLSLSRILWRSFVGRPMAP